MNRTIVFPLNNKPNMYGYVDTYLGMVKENLKSFLLTQPGERVIQENISREWDGFIGLCDDVELLPNTLEKAVLLHNQKFFDTDGVVGFAQDCPGYPRYTFKWFGQTLIGRKFVERYRDANYQICCPDYYHFGYNI